MGTAVKKMRNYSNIIIIGFFLMQAIACKEADVKDEIGATEEDIAIMSYNILQDDPKRPAGYLWSERRDRLMTLIHKYQPDILCAQEDYYSQGRDIMQETGWGKVGVSRNAGTSTGDGEFVAIFYDKERFIPKKWGHFWLSETPQKPSIGWDAAVVRICNWALFTDKNTKKDFYVFNTHTDHKGAEARLKSAELILDSVQHIAKNDPVIVAGDMNATPESPPVNAFKVALTDSRAVSEKQPIGPEATFNGADGRVPERLIDYIFINDDFKVLQHVIADDSENGLYPSDHFPVFTVLAFK